MLRSSVHSTVGFSMVWLAFFSITTRFDNNWHYLRGNKGNFQKSESEEFNRPIKNCFAVCAWGERVKITTFNTCFSSLSSPAACFLSSTASYRLICWCLSFVCGTYSFGGDNFEWSQPGRKPRNFCYPLCKLVTHKKFFIHALRIKFCKFLPGICSCHLRENVWVCRRLSSPPSPLLPPFLQLAVDRLFFPCPRSEWSCEEEEQTVVVHK